MKADWTPAATMPSRILEMPTWLLSRAFAHSHRLLFEGFASADSHGYHYRLLATLLEAGPASQAVLGRLTRIDRSDVVAALNDLAERGFIERSTDPEDRRRNVVTITPAGVDHVRKLDDVVAGIQEKVLARLSAAERKQFLRLLKRMLGDA
jgi:DNA-binding MarR family transcriptional regulator